MNRSASTTSESLIDELRDYADLLTCAIPQVGIAPIAD